ncbi:MAG: hypothetical protein EOP11_25350 [Proteobacteria bacterium]|nr:MAG: hypothetical protein EOP11_25350 [Pseudomonadota bacterium]
MKTLLTLLLTLSPLAANADFLPGRTRPSAEASLEAFKADGIYKGVESARLIQFQTDGQGVSRYDLVINGRTETYEVQEVKEQRCGDEHVARAVDETNGRGEIRLFNFLSTLCEARNNEPEWTVKVERHQADKGEISSLDLAGIPEYYMLSQGL